MKVNGYNVSPLLQRHKSNIICVGLELIIDNPLSSIGMCFIKISMGKTYFYVGILIKRMKGKRYER